MNRSETARLLAMVAAFNNRTIGEADVIAWQSVLPDVALADAEEAVRRHYAESTEWLMPAHIRRLARDIVRERSMSPWAPGQHGVPREEAQPEVPTAGRLALADLPEAVADLVALVRADLPAGNREALFPRRVAWEREHRAYQRQQDAMPNPAYKPPKAGCPYCSVSLESECPWHPATGTLDELACAGDRSCRPASECPAEKHWWEAPA